MLEALVAFLIVLVIIAVLCGIAYAIVRSAPIPEPFKTIAVYVIWGAGVIALLLAIMKYLVPILP